MTVDLFRYFWGYVAVLAALVGVSVLVDSLFETSLPSGLSTVLPPMLAALIEGQRMGKHVDSVPHSNSLWAQAGLLTGVVAVVNTVILATLYMLTNLRDIILSMPVLFTMVFAGLLLLGVFVVNRLFLAIGIKGALNARKKASPPT